MILRPPRSTRTDTLFPYTTLFRSAGGNSRGPHGAAVVRARCLPSSPPPPQAPFGAKHDERAARAEQGEREPGDRIDQRSEEHTSELQSLMRISYAVFCLKKKTTKN